MKGAFSHQVWSESDIEYLKKAEAQGIPRKKIAENLGRSAFAVAKKISRLQDEELEKLSFEEKHVRLRKMCEYYMTHKIDSSAAQIYRSFGLPENFFTHAIYTPSAKDREEIAKYQDAYDHFKEGCALDVAHPVLTKEELQQVKKMYCEQHLSIISIATALNQNHYIISETIRNNGWKRSFLTPVTADTIKQIEKAKDLAEVKPATAPKVEVVSEEYHTEDPAEYMEIAAPLVEEYNRTLDWYQQISREYTECKANISKLSKALESLRL